MVMAGYAFDHHSLLLLLFWFETNESRIWLQQQVSRLKIFFTEITRQLFYCFHTEKVYILYQTVPFKHKRGSHLTIFCLLVFRWYSWTVHGSPSTIWVRRVPPGVQLPVPRGLCGQGEAVPGNHLSSSSLQDQIPGKFLPFARQPWKCQYKQNIRLLWWMWVSWYFYTYLSPLYIYAYSSTFKSGTVSFIKINEYW